MVRICFCRERETNLLFSIYQNIFQWFHLSESMNPTIKINRKKQIKNKNKTKQKTATTFYILKPIFVLSLFLFTLVIRLITIINNKSLTLCALFFIWVLIWNGCYLRDFHIFRLSIFNIIMFWILIINDKRYHQLIELTKRLFNFLISPYRFLLY